MRSFRLHFWITGPVAVMLAAAILAGCVSPTPAPLVTLTPGAPDLPSETPPPVAYPAAAASDTPLPAASDTPESYPAGATNTPESVAGTATTVATETTAPTDTVAPSDTPLPGPTATAARAFVTYQDDGTNFTIAPAQTNIKVGTTVIFLIKSTSGAFHQPFSQNPAGIFESPAELGEGTSFSFTFNQAGTIVISCGYHEALMQANLVVEP